MDHGQRVGQSDRGGGPAGGGGGVALEMLTLTMAIQANVCKPGSGHLPLWVLQVPFLNYTPLLSAIPSWPQRGWF